MNQKRRPGGGQNRQGKPQKPKSPQISAEIFAVPLPVTAPIRQKIDRAIKGLPFELGAEHGEPDQTVSSWLTGLKELERRFFYHQAAGLEPEKLLDSLKKLATAKDDGDRTKKAKELGLLLETSALPSRAQFKFRLLIQQLRQRKPPHVAEPEAWRKKLDELEQWGKDQEPLTIFLAPLKAPEAVSHLLMLLELTNEEREQYLGVKP